VRLLYFFGWFCRAWNRLAHAEKFEYNCRYCGAKTAQGPYTDSGVLYPACCSRMECLDRWESVRVK
jgi:hypothetical protein